MSDRVDPLADTVVPLTPPEPAPPSPVRARELGLVIALLCAVYLPFLGSHNLWDPWETHYGEVARRMLEDHDWVKTNWQNESFRSKPVLTFWLMGAGMKVFGLGQDGGHSGELAMSPYTEWAIRLPFALSGIAGLTLLWFALARLATRRLAWLATLICATMPFFALVARQAITDMPSCAMLLSSMALFALAIWDDGPLPKRGRFVPDGQQLFLAALAVVVLPQLVYFVFNVQGTKWMLSRTAYIPGPLIMIPFFVAYAVIVFWILRGPRTRRQVYMDWFFLLSGVAVLAKGPVGPGLAGLTILIWLIVTGEWKLLRELGILRGLVIGALVCLPWHFAIFLRDGMGWLHEYISTHLLGRMFQGVHGDRGTFLYYFQELGIGMWPWVCLVPGALVHLATAGRPSTREGHLRLLFAVWGIVAFAFFSFTRTKFHHYILPAVPAFAVMVAFWLEDLRAGRVERPRLAVGAALVLFLVTAFDVVTRQERFPHLFIYRYDRPWPYEQPWAIDFTPWLALFAALFLVGVVLLATRARRFVIPGMVAVAIVWTLFLIDVLIPAAGPHWGQRELHREYYRKRELHGVDLYYEGGKEIVADWGEPRDLEVRSYIPATLSVGAPMKVRWFVVRIGKTEILERGELAGKVASIDADGERFTIAIPDDERAKIAALVEKSRKETESRRRRVFINADRMLAWQLFWRGENFWSGGEIWNRYDPDMQTVFNDYNDPGGEKFKKYLEERRRQGKKFWAVTEIGRLQTLKGLLPTPAARKTFRKRDESSNKFGLASFSLVETEDDGPVIREE